MLSGGVTGGPCGGEGGAAGDVAEGRYAEEGGGGPSGHLVELGELGVGSGEADFQALDFAVPSFAFGFGDAVEKVAADLADPGPLVRGRPQERASQVPLTELTTASA
jgi:hypothetical protein